MYPKNSLSYVENFLYMMFGTPCEEWVPNPVLTNAMERILILHADHEQNASTSTVRLAGSTGANPFACVAAGIASLWGPAHGGANEAVLKMLDEIGDVKNIPAFIKRVKEKDGQAMLMGFGHRVYKNYDPRAKIIQKTCHEVLEELKLKDNKLIELAMALEKIALEDDYFIQRKLYPNVDFYSGIVYKALGIPVEHVHRDFRAGAHHGLDRAVERTDHRHGTEDRPSAPAVHRVRPSAISFRLQNAK